MQQLPALLQGGDARSMRTGVTGRARTAAKSAWAHSEVFSDEDGAGGGAPTMSGMTAAQKSARGARGAKSAGEQSARLHEQVEGVATSVLVGSDACGLPRLLLAWQAISQYL